MSVPPPRSRLTLLFLWVCPLAGMSVFIGAILRCDAPPPFHRLDNGRFFDVPGLGWVAIIIASLSLPLVIACITRRAKSFIASASLLVLLISILGWIRSHFVSDEFWLTQLNRSSADQVVRQQVFVSAGGGMSFRSRRISGEAVRNFTVMYLLALGRDESLSHEVTPATGEYPVDLSSYSRFPPWLERLGFTAQIKPAGYWNEKEGGTVFALTLPYWFICPLTALLPIRWVIQETRQRRALRANPNACLNCGYDLRATPDGLGAKLPVCPECGTATAEKEPG
jgi:hypothetical protein